jgi:hypothetical protein
MTLWNYLRDTYKKVSNKISNLYEYIKDYFSGHHDKWIFISGHTIPLPMNKLNNAVSVDWVYDNNTCTLVSFPNDSNHLVCKFSWLSAKLRVSKSNLKEGEVLEYNLDEFIDNFRLITTDKELPTLYDILMSWCAYSKHWLCATDYIEFSIIDDEGNDEVINLEEHNDCLEIKHQKIYIVVHNPSENEMKTKI